MTLKQVLLVTGARKGIGRNLVEYYLQKKFEVIGCSRQPTDLKTSNYRHFCLDVADEQAVIDMFSEITNTHKRLDILINNAGIASMNHILLTPLTTVERIFSTNVLGTFLLCREAAKLMMKNRFGRIVNFSSVALPLKLAGEAVYASSKSAVVNLTQNLAKAFSEFNITVNAIGPTPIATDLIRSVPKEKINDLLDRQAIRRLGEFSDVTNAIDFFIRPDSDLVTGQVLYLGGVS